MSEEKREAEATPEIVDLELDVPAEVETSEREGEEEKEREKRVLFDMDYLKRFRDVKIIN